MLAMVVDVGAGTSDFSLYRILLDPDTGANDAREVHGSARAITEAGNHLDGLLVQFILKKADVTSTHPKFMKIYSRLELQKRNYKESLFNDRYVYVPLHPDADDVLVELEEFLALEAVRKFESSLRETARDILASVDESLLGWVTANPKRYLTVVLTGGGASLPMVRSLASGSIEVHGRKITLQPALPFPGWLQEEYPELEEDYARVAVSLGGARKRVISKGSAIHVTAGDIVQPPKLGGYYVKGM
jgi:molecular chaperone HscA